MDVIDAIKQRRSIRGYLDRPVEAEKLERVLEAGRLAPSANNRQEWRFIIVRDKQMRQELMQAAASQSFVAEAPVVIAACADTDERVMRCGQLAYPIDVAISIDHITLKAVEEGLGTCWIGAFNGEMVKELLKIPPQIRVVELLTLGYPAAIPHPTPRKRFDQIIKYERWE